MRKSVPIQRMWPFSSTKKRMSVIIKKNDGLRLYTKGASEVRVITYIYIYMYTYRCHMLICDRSCWSYAVNIRIITEKCWIYLPR